MAASEPVYVTGHQHPDTDSIASSIAYAFFKRSMGIRAIPCRLGPVNAESAWLLKRFGFPEPTLLTDARVRLSDIKLDPPTFIKPDTTIHESLRQMQESGHTYCGIVDDEMHLLGLLTKGDIGEVGLGDTHSNIDILSRTPLDNFVRTLDGRLVYEDADMHINGKVSLIAMTGNAQLDDYQIKDRIVILGNDKDAQKRVIEKGAGMLIIVWADTVAPDVIEIAREYHCPIILSGHGAMNTSRYIYFAPPAKYIMETNLVSFSANELAEDVGKKMLRSRYHIYPVVDNEKKLLGYIGRYHIMNCRNKQIILVDHNEFSQSVRAIEKARVLEVIDHHRINDFSTTQPVSFRNEIVGSSATIVSTIFRENQIPIPQNLAGLLLGALLSDTMNFHSPTTTPKDLQTANILAAIADLDLDVFAREMFAVTANTSGKTYQEMINQDMKIYDIKECKLSISQVIVSSTDEIRSDAESIQPVVEQFAAKKQLDFSVLVFTSILENGSVIFAGGNHAAWAVEAFPNGENEEHSFQKDLLSRKKQILPLLTEVISKYL
ncbi:MAG: putative manganese-dependent inorganic diphosphatase [Lachnospiraceae bacterium]|nr:putative manganese-dependent inorganic diphosphatase [Lachnospiraceae bacterium]